MPAYRVNGKFVSKEVYDEFHKLQEQEESNKPQPEVEDNMKEDKAEKAIKENKEYKEEQTKGKRGRKKKGESSTPKLTCICTGHQRVTSWKYLEEKAEKKGVSVAHLMEWYISKNIASQMRKRVNNGVNARDALIECTNKENIDNIRALIKSDEDAMTLLNMNSKSGGSFKKKEEDEVDDTSEEEAAVVVEEVEEISDEDLDECFNELEEEVAQ